MLSFLSSTSKKIIIIIAGPTAVGKTALSIQLAQHFNTQIISADSRQCFKELTIGAAKPSREELQQATHYFINSHNITDIVNVGTYEQYALDACSQIFMQNDVAIMVGGTGLYIKAFCEGIDNMPSVPSEIREHIFTQYHQFGLNWLQENLKTKDPLFWKTAEQQNPQRLMRALEIVETTGQSINYYKSKTQLERPFNILKIGLELPREELIYNINQRVDGMIETGLLNEVKSLLNQQHLNALQTVGYKELFTYLKGDCSLEAAINQIKINTRQYAKRQMTWFKKDAAFTWFKNSAPVFKDVKTLLAEMGLT